MLEEFAERAEDCIFLIAAPSGLCGFETLEPELFLKRLPEKVPVKSAVLMISTAFSKTVPDPGLDFAEM